MFLLDKADRRLALDAKPLTAGHAAIEIGTSAGVLTHELLQLTDTDRQALARGDGIDLELSIDADAAVSLRLRHSGSRDVHVAYVRVLIEPADFEPALEAQQYRQLISPRSIDPAAGVKPVHLRPTWADDHAPSSCMYTVLSRNADGAALLLGALPPYGPALTVFRLRHAAPHMEGRFGLEITYDLQATLSAGAEWRLSPIVALAGSDGTTLMGAYAELLQRRLDQSRKPIATGWNSWDYYMGAVRRSDIDENTEAARKHLGDQVRYIVVDEGYERQWGEWDAGWKFPEGLEAMVRRVREAGYEAGVWTAPLLASVHTPRYRFQPHWFARDRGGHPYAKDTGYGRMGILDITQPEVQAHLEEVYTRLREDGFSYFKCDFTQCALEADCYADPSVGRGQIIRDLFKLIRRCIGDEAYLLSCGAPFESVIGIADAFRVTSDIHIYWSQVCQNLRALLVRWWFQGSVGNLDPDFVVLRSPQTTDDPVLQAASAGEPRNAALAWLDGRLMNETEARVWALATYVFGGETIFGDRLEALQPEALSLMPRLLPPLDTPGRPLNLFRPDGMVAPIVMNESKRGTLLALFNLTEDPYVHRLDLPGVTRPVQARAFWNDEPVVLDPTIEYCLSARSAVAWWL